MLTCVSIMSNLGVWLALIDIKPHVAPQRRETGLSCVRRWSKTEKTVSSKVQTTKKGKRLLKQRPLKFEGSIVLCFACCHIIWLWLKRSHTVVFIMVYTILYAYIIIYHVMELITVVDWWYHAACFNIYVIVYHIVTF